ncbi:MAG: HAMP domain-containing sensor histidine kinase [Gudongella sp.]|nr:HAMP domain-containing sensor histidine kinase [Gudongella sp.]
MIEILRRKFIVISVSAAFIVVFVIGFFSNLSNYSQIGRNADELLYILAENDGYFPKEDEHDLIYKLPPKISPEAPFSTRFFTVKMDEEESVIEVDTGKISSISTKQALTYANEVLESEKKSGFEGEYKYLVVNKDYGSLLVFVNIGQDLQIFYSFLKSSIMTGVIGIIGVFIIVLVFSKKAIAPIAESYEKQKQFITNAGHELKTPLAIINTDAEVIEMNYGESQWTKSIHNQVRRLSNLVESLVSLTRMDEEKNQLLKNEFSLSELVLETAEEFHEISTVKGKELVLEVEKGINYVGNEESLGQLVAILIDNALKYGLKDDSITVRLKRQGKKCFLQTTNRSENLSVGNYDVLFERFYRADSSRNSKLEGYGIGLSVAKAIVAKHKGKISAESLDGDKIIFTVQL